MEGPTMELSLSSGTAVNNVSSLDETSKTVTSDSSIVDSSSISDITGDSSIISFDIVSFNDRSIEIRDGRLAHALDSLDENLPQDVDDTIKDLAKSHANSTPTALGHMGFLVIENYLEYNKNLTAKRSLEKKLPKSKGRRFSPK